MNVEVAMGVASAVAAGRDEFVAVLVSGNAAGHAVLVDIVAPGRPSVGAPGRVLTVGGAAQTPLRFRAGAGKHALNIPAKTAPVLSPTERAGVDRFGIHDEDVISLHQEDDQPVCEAVTGCEKPAVARFVVCCPCRKMRLGCTPHIESTARWFDQAAARCKTCGALVTGYRIVPL